MERFASLANFELYFNNELLIFNYEKVLFLFSIQRNQQLKYALKKLPLSSFVSRKIIMYLVKEMFLKFNYGKTSNQTVPNYIVINFYDLALIIKSDQIYNNNC